LQHFHKLCFNSSSVGEAQRNAHGQQQSHTVPKGQQIHPEGRSHIQYKIPTEGEEENRSQSGDYQRRRNGSQAIRQDDPRLNAAQLIGQGIQNRVEAQ